MRAGRHDVARVRLRESRLLALLLGLFLVGVAGTAATQSGAPVGAARADTVTASHIDAWTLPRAVPERQQAQHAGQRQALGGDVVLASPAVLRTGSASAYLPTTVAACCGTSLPAWAGRGPPALL
jgi:hypothetical protein